LQAITIEQYSASTRSSRSREVNWAEVGGANFDRYNYDGTGITPAQLYSTASYLSHDLSECYDMAAMGCDDIASGAGDAVAYRGTPRGRTIALHFGARQRQ
jgi:hypothetical protein